MAPTNQCNEPTHPQQHLLRQVLLWTMKCPLESTYYIHADPTAQLVYVTVTHTHMHTLCLLKLRELWLTTAGLSTT